MTPIQEMKFGNIQVKIFGEKKSLGAAAADFVAQKLESTAHDQGVARAIFATGASQFEFIDDLVRQMIPWGQVHAFHLDEYVGLSMEHPASFRKYLKERLFDKVLPAKVHYLDGTSPDLQAECDRYTQLLLEDEIDIACIGIGENGHIAFNDPPVADFNDPEWVKVVELDAACRQQQLGEGWFPTLDDVPREALTQTVPAIMRSKCISCFVPDARKAEAVKNALTGPVDTSCPASILREHPNIVLWLDEPAASML